MKTLPVIFAAVILCTVSAFSQQQAAENIYFNSGSYTLTADAIVKLDKLINKIDYYGNCNIRLTGHTDMIGSEDQNLKLAGYRVKMVKHYLESKISATAKFETHALGEEKPVASNETTEGMAKNRRVEIVVIPVSREMISDLYNKLSGQFYEYQIDPRKDTVLYGDQGSVITIPANCFEFKNSSIPVTTVAFEIKEVFKISDMLLENLSTTAGTHQLETAGMICMKASCDGKELRLKPGYRLNIQLPVKGEYKEDMQLFYGKRDKKGRMNWVLDRTGKDDRYKRARKNRNRRGNRYGGIGGSNRMTFLERVVCFFGGLVGQGCLADYDFTYTTEQKLKKYKGDLEETYKGRENEHIELNSREQQALKYYAFNSSNLGWINCDRFSNTNEEKINYVVSDECSDNTDIKIVFRDIQSIMQGYPGELPGFNFVNVPIDREVYIVGMRFNKGKPELAMQKATISRLPVQNLDYRPVTFAELKKELEILN